MKGKYKYLLLIVIDIVFVNLAVFAALFLRMEMDFSSLIDSGFLKNYLYGIPVLTALYLTFSYLLRTHAVLWVFSTMRDVCKLGFACVFSIIFYMVVSMPLNIMLPRSVYFVSAVFMPVSVIFIRLVDRTYTRRYMKSSSIEKWGKGILIIGAVAAADILIREIRTSVGGRDKSIYVIDDDSDKREKFIYGAKVVGDRNFIEEAVRKYNIDTIIFAIPSCPKDERIEILKICSHTDCEIKTLPNIKQMLDGKYAKMSLRKVEIEDLLGREPINIHSEKVMGYVKGKTVMVTGGGGSIGSELCRQIAANNPERLIIFDIYENNAYDILNELKFTYPGLDVIALIGSVRDSHRLECVFSEYKPQIVYHAAAHKHVPLMEDSPNEAVKNNVFGTLKTVMAADRHKVEKFVLISTDKAVNPTNIMGASKRICEMIIQSYNKHSDTIFAAVRFGNVLGSNGSVIPLFKKQIEAGGPVTVTHPDIIRYFMTIPEAVSLVLKAGANANGGEIFVLNMGEPVHIVELAENLILLSGYTPYKDIDIKFTGLRPGEKLYEELLMSEEGLRTTEDSLIFIGKPIELDEDLLKSELSSLKEAMYDEGCDIRQMVHKLVPIYKYNGEAFSDEKENVKQDVRDIKNHQSFGSEEGNISVKNSTVKVTS